MSGEAWSSEESQSGNELPHSKAKAATSRRTPKEGDVMRLQGMIGACVAAVLAIACASHAAEEQEPFTLVVMDPLAAPLACDCVQGYAQRDYTKLGEFLKPYVGEVRVVFAQSLEKSLDGKPIGRADVIIGKDSVIRYDAKKTKREVAPVAALTGKDGKTTQTGLFVVLNADPAEKVADLKGYRIFFGPEDCDEKSAAPLKLLKSAGVPTPEKIETCPACSEAATKVLELGPEVRSAAVISSYAEPLLEGCGTIKKGDLRVIGETPELPFVTAFVDSTLPAEARKKIVDGLMEVQYDINMLGALESKQGFVPYAATTPTLKPTAELSKKKAAVTP
jgi:ABC-type phosphate/phosphonate transport system substrate-binding protein